MLLFQRSATLHIDRQLSLLFHITHILNLPHCPRSVT